MRRLYALLIIMLACYAPAIAASYIYKEGKGVVYAWEGDEMIRAYFVGEKPINGYIMFAGSVQSDPHYTLANAGGFSLTENYNYCMFFPYKNEHYGVWQTALPVTYRGQKQVANGDVSHLAEYDYLTGRKFVRLNDADFSLTHHGAVLRIHYSVSEATTVSGITLKDKKGKWVTDAKVNAEEDLLTPMAYSDSISLAVDDVIVDDGSAMVAYMMIAPNNMAGDTITVRVKGVEGDLKAVQVTGADFKAGRMYDINLDGGSAAANAKLAVAVEEENKMVCENVMSTSSKPQVYVPDFTTADVATGELKVLGALLGDVNQDGYVTMADANLVVSYYLNPETTHLPNLNIADMNGDGYITMADANQIVNIFLNVK